MHAKNRLRHVERARGVYIDEELTVIRARVVRELRHQGYVVNTRDGKISARKEGYDTLWIDYPQDFANLPWGEDKFRELGITPDF